MAQSPDHHDVGRDTPCGGAQNVDWRDLVHVPAKLAARVRLFDTGHDRKTDAHDAHSIAIVAVRTTGLRVLTVDGQLQALRMLVDRRDALSRRRVQTVNRLHALLAELLGAGEEGHHRVAGQGAYSRRCAPVTSPGRPAGGSPPRSWPSWSRWTPRSSSTAELNKMVLARESHLMDLRGVGPVVAAPRR